MAVTQMTRAEYEKKYGTKPPATASTTLDTQPSPVTMTRAQYEMRYGVKPDGAPVTIADKPNPLFGNPVKTVTQAGGDVHSAIAGEGAYKGKNSVERGFSAAATTANTIPSLAADVIPGGHAILDTVGKVAGAGINFFGNASTYLADAAEKVGLMTPEQRKQYDERNAAFTETPLGIALESAASIGKSSGDIANVILGAHGAAESAQHFINKDLPALQARAEEAHKTFTEARYADAISKTADEIASVESKYAKGRKANVYSKDEGASSRTRIAQSGVLKNSVDESGLLRTQQQGGALDQYKAMTIQPWEGVVRQNLLREGGKTNLSQVRETLVKQVEQSGLEGADLITALRGVDREIEGLRLKADELGYVPNVTLHDAKINTTGNINFQTPPETATYRKALARGYKQLVEDNTHSIDVRAVNHELSKYYDDIARLERLDGARVTGGKLGRYAAQISGNIIGGAFGSLFGAPGIAVGTVLGGELTSMLKGKSMAGSFGRVKEGVVPSNPILDAAKAKVDAPSQTGAAGGPPNI